MHLPTSSLLLPLLTLITIATSSPSARAASNHLAARDTPVKAEYDQASCDEDTAQPPGAWDQDTATAIMCDVCGLQWACNMIAGTPTTQQNQQGQAAWPVPSPVQYPTPDNSTESQSGADSQFQSGDGSPSGDGS